MGHVITSINGFYNDTAYNVINGNYQGDIDWMVKNKLNPTGWDYVSLYHDTTMLASSHFPAFIKACNAAKIYLGIAYSSTGEVDSVVAFNKANPQSKLTFLTSELETYSNPPNCTEAEFEAWIQYAYKACQANGMLHLIYNAWNTPWNIMVANSDAMLLTDYRTSTQMATKDDAFDYMLPRLSSAANAAKALGIVYNISVLSSCEPTYGLTYFKTHAWTDSLKMFLDSWERLATPTMKTWLNVNAAFIFETKYMEQAKP